MLGKPKRCEPKLFYPGVSLEERIPPAHPLRRIRACVDFGFARSEVAPLYGPNGHASLDPAVVLKLMFLCFYENVPSERQLMEQLPLRLDWLWFCEYDLDEKTPHHSVLSKARARWGTAVFERFFLNVLEQCLTAGLIDGRTIHVDSSLIDGNADIRKVRPQLRVLCAALVEKLDTAAATESSEPEDRSDDADDPPLHPRVNPADPDARIGCKPGETVLGYKDHRVVDDRHGIITATITTPANTADNHVLGEAVETHEDHTSRRVEMVVADSIYGTADNYEQLQRQGKRCCIPRQRHGTRADAAVSHDRFTYDAPRDVYVCPAGQVLRRYDRVRSHGGGVRYRAARKTCEACRHFTSCVRSRRHGRQILRNDRTAIVTWADACCSGLEWRRLQRRRRYKAEGSFADAANNHGFKRARWRGLAYVTMQNLLIAAVQNLRKLLRYGGRGPAQPSGQARVSPARGQPMRCIPTPLRLGLGILQKPGGGFARVFTYWFSNRICHPL